MKLLDMITRLITREKIDITQQSQGFEAKHHQTERPKSTVAVTRWIPIDNHGDERSLSIEPDTQRKPHCEKADFVPTETEKTPVHQGETD